MPRWQVWFYLAAGTALFGSSTPVSRLASEHFPPMLASGLRVFAGTLFLAPFLFRKGENPWCFNGRQWIRFIFLCIAGVFGFTVLLIFGMERLSGASGSITMSLTPALTALAAYLFMRERFGWLRTAGLLLTVAGIVLMALKGGEGKDTLTGFLLILAAVICEVAYTLLGKSLTGVMRPVSLAAWSALGGSILFLLPVFRLADEVNWERISTEGWVSVLWWGVGVMGLGSLCWYRGLKSADGSVAAGFMGIMPLAGLLTSYWLLGESFLWVHALGMATVLAGVTLTARTASKVS